VPPHAQSEPPLVRMQGGTLRLDVSALGVDDSLVDEVECVALVAALQQQQPLL
jgi:hypothetical protein